MEPFDILPEDITLDILTRVPTESVRDCKLVCKTWRNLVSQNPSFSKMHLQHLNHPSTAAADSGKSGFVALTGNKLYYIEYDETLESIQRTARIDFIFPYCNNKIVGSCNGLICITRNFFYQQVCICNPITREYLILPVIKEDYCEDEDTDGELYGFEPTEFWRNGFGYIPSTNEYKVVSILLTMKYVEVHIYTLGSGNGWRNLGKFNFGPQPDWEEGEFFNGVLYWLDDVSGMMVTFDLADEKFGEHLPPPPLQSYGSCSDYISGVLDGFLFVFVGVIDYVQGAHVYDVWLLKNKNDEDHGIKEQPQEHKALGWTKEFRVDNSKLFAVTKTGKVLTYYHGHVDIYDTIASNSKRLVDFGKWINRVIPHKNTLVSLKELGEQDIKAMESVEVTESDLRPMKQL